MRNVKISYIRKLNAHSVVPSLHLLLIQTPSSSKGSDMKSTLSVLSLAVLVGVAACMSLQECEDDDEMAPLGCWHVHIHVHFHRLLMNDKDVSHCYKNKCMLCKVTDFAVEIKTNNETLNAVANYKGCVVVTKRGGKYDFEVLLGGKSQYITTFELNDKTLLPCLDAKKRDAQICPLIYDVDLKKGKMCALFYENFVLKTTQLKHEVQLGCADLTEEWLLE